MESSKLRRFITPFLLALLLMSTGCSSKKYFEPESVKDDWEKTDELNASLLDVNRYGGVLERSDPLFFGEPETDSFVWAADRILPVKIPDGYRYIGHNDSYLIGASTRGEMVLVPFDPTASEMKLALGKTVAAASLEKNTLAVLFADNTVAVYDAPSQSLIMKEQGNPPTAVDNRIANPQFLNELVLVPTLDGKVLILNTQTKQTLRTIIISSKPVFDNVIYLKLVGDTMVAATGSRVFSMAEKERRESFEIRDIEFSEDGLWLTTKQGEVMALTSALETVAKVKFPFAHFIGMIVGQENVYLLEKEGYLIVMSKDLSHHEVYDVDLEDGQVYVGNNAFYIDDSIIMAE